MTFFYLKHKKVEEKTEEEREKSLMHDLYQSCQSGYKNYLLDDKITQELTVNCCKYLFFRKSKSNLPADRLFRYTSQLAEDLF